LTTEANIQSGTPVNFEFWLSDSIEQQMVTLIGGPGVRLKVIESNETAPNAARGTQNYEFRSYPDPSPRQQEDDNCDSNGVEGFRAGGDRLIGVTLQFDDDNAKMYPTYYDIITIEKGET